MSSQYNKHERFWTFDCDGDDCRRNHEGAIGDDARMAWVAAKADGWVNSVEYVRGISTWRHFCPECKKQLGD